MVWGTLLIVSIIFTVLSFRYYSLLLSFFAMLFWIALWAFNLDNHPTIITPNTLVFDILTYTFIGMAILVMLTYFRNRGKAKGMFNTNTENEGVAPDADTTLRGRGMMDLSNSEYKQYIRLKMRSKRR